MEDITPYFDQTGHGAMVTERRLLVRRIRDYCANGDAMERQMGVVMTFLEDYLPPELEKDVEQFTLPLPKAAQLRELIHAVHDDWVGLHPGSWSSTRTRSWNASFRPPLA